MPDPGEELQLDWLELRETPWARPAYVLVGVLSHSGRLRGVFSEGQSFAHLAAALDQLLRRFGATARRWRTDRMASFVYPATDRLRPEAAELAKHYGVAVSICPAERPQRKGAVEKGIDYLTRSWWTSAAVATPAQAQSDLDRWCISTADGRRRSGASVGALADAEPLLALPGAAFPALLEAERAVFLGGARSPDLPGVPMATEITDARTGRPQRLATYSVDAGERALVGQRVDGVVRISDVPATGAGRSYLVEPEIASTAELEALVADYSEGREARLRADARVVLRSHGVRPRWRAQCWIHAKGAVGVPTTNARPRWCRAPDWKPLSLNPPFR